MLQKRVICGCGGCAQFESIHDQQKSGERKENIEEKLNSELRQKAENKFGLSFVMAPRRLSSVGPADTLLQAQFSEKKWVWVADKEEGYIAGWIARDNGNDVEVEFADGKKRTLSIDDTEKMNPPKFDKAEDMADLTYLNEASVVHNLGRRYASNLIYTYSGLFLVAINPYKKLPLYGEEMLKTYKGRKRCEMPPHIYAVADNAYSDMLQNRENQSILITGESGAGKTENTKKVIQYLTFSASASRGRLGTLEQQILQANPILESFGNAQTIRNNNSSRFGKFIKLEFNPMGRIVGANIERYLLEKSRVTHQSTKERSYHVFYQLLKGAPNEMKKQLLLDGSLIDYRFTKLSNKDIDSVDDTLEFKNLVIDFFRVVAAILHLGNVGVIPDRDDQAILTENGQREAEKVCHLLGISVDDFSKSLLRPRIKAGRDWVVQSRDVSQVEYSIEALSRAMYERMFGSLVERINEAMGSSGPKSTYIGVLDIAGFEIFERNSFEQLCINYTNEKLQQFFNHHMFVIEQEEYKKEGIEWKFIDFGLDLQPTIDLIEKTTPVGILSCLDEECVMPKATDKTLMEKLSALWKGKSSKFDVPRFNSGFIIQHYAGVVEYDLDGWLDKNKDPLNENITRLLASSSDKFVASLFSDCAEYEDSPAKNRGITKRGAFRTVAQRHKEQLGLLMSQLYSTDPHFVRCIIPNGEKRPSKLDVNMILDQLRCNGVLEGIRICRAGFPNRLSFSDFRQRYELLAPKVIPKGFMDGQRGALLLIDALNLETNQYRLGTSKVFFKTGVLADLEERRDNKLTALVIRIQAMARGRIARKLYKKRIDQCRAIKIIQKNARIYVTLREWSWWKLYTKVKPLLNATRVDEELRRKDEQLKEWEELAKRERDDRARLENLQHALESEKKMMEELLFQEKNAAADQAEILARTQKRESDLNERLQQTTLLLEEKEQYVEKLLAMKSKLQSDYECVAERLAESQLLVEKAERDKNQRTEMLNGVEQELKQAAETASRLESERRNLEKQLHDAQAVLDSLSDQCNDMSRTQARAKASLADTESKLEQALQHSKAMEEKKLALEVDIARLRDSVADLTRSKADVESLLKRKEAELRDCLERLNEEKRVRENAEKSRRELQVSFNALKADYEAESLEREKSIRVRKKLEEELQHMALLIEERGSEETKQSELRRLREVELSDLKGQLGSTLQELENSRKHASLSIDKLNMELEAAKGELSLSSKAKGALETQKSEARAEIERLEDQNNRLEKAKRHLEQELSGARSAIADLDLQVEDLKVGKENAEAKVASLVARLDTSESLAARFEREKMSALRQIDSLKEELESATQKIVHQESLRKRDQTEISDLKARLEEDELARSELGRKLATQAQELATTKERLSKEMASKVAEHDEMKRRLEKELQEAGQKLLDIERNATNLEKSKSRLSTEVEDLHLELDKAYSSARNFERISKQLESQLTSTNVQLETERRQKETAESSVRKLQTALDSISVEFEEKQKEAAVVTKLKTDLELELKALIGEFGDHGKNLHELEKVKRKLEVHVLELEDSLAQERQLRANADEQRHSLEAQMADLRRKYDADLALKNTALEDTRRMLMKEVNSLGEQLEEVTQQKNDLFRQKKKMEESLELYSSRAESNAKGQSELEKAKRKADQALRELQNQLEDSERLRKNMEELALRHEQRANQLQASAELQEGQIEGLERSKRALEMRVEDLLQSIKSFEEGKATSVEEIRALEIQVKELENQLEEERLSRLQLESVKLYNASDIEQACSKTKEELEGKIEKLEESRRALLASQRIAQQELEDKANDVANMDKQRRLLQCEISDLKARLESEMMAKTDEVAARRRLANELKETQLKPRRTQPCQK
ncbi:myosin heavy chain [Zopfochytrium polystomum]|nr:myosin heavy chain [Zopfochytrium polystomum]